MYKLIKVVAYLLLVAGQVNCSHSESETHGLNAPKEIENWLASKLVFASESSTEVSLPPSPPAPTVSKKCTQDLTAFVFGLLDPKLKFTWVKTLLDSWGKLPAGLLQGTTIWPGSYSECKDLKAAYKLGNVSGDFKGQYNIAVWNVSLSLIQKGAKGSALFHYGYCLPDSCDPSVFKTLYDKIEKYLSIPASLKYVMHNIIEYGVYNEVRDDMDMDWRGIFAFVVASIFAFVIVVATLYDIYTRYKKKSISNSANKEQEVNNAAHINTEVENITLHRSSSLTVTLIDDNSRSTGLLAKMLLSFSAYKNGEKILNTDRNEKTLACVHGIRFLSMTWVILGHTYYFGLSVVERKNYLAKLSDTFAFQAIGIGGQFSVDTFFLLSSTLVAYLFFNHLERVGSIKRIGWLKFYLHRIWRLTPAYMLILFIYVCLFRYVGSGPFWHHDGVEKDFCKDTWWTNLLYVNNLVRTKYMCMGWTWYLANDMQFYVISPLLLIPLALFKFVGIAMLCVALAISWGISAYVIHTDHIVFGLADPNALQEYYIKPYVRIGPYLIGLLLGFIIHKTKCNIRLKKVYVLLGWTFATAIGLSVVYGLYHTHPNSDTYNSNLVLSRSAWAVAVGWVIFACIHGYGGFVNTILSWKALIPLSRLTYCAYLIHPVVMYYFYFTRHTLIEPNQAVFVPYFFSHLCVSYGIAFILSISFESPMMNIEKVLLSQKGD